MKHKHKPTDSSPDQTDQSQTHNSVAIQRNYTVLSNGFGPDDSRILGYGALLLDVWFQTLRGKEAPLSVGPSTAHPTTQGVTSQET
jgi:hypothetical protein